MQAVIFDMDGVLVDSEPLWQRAQLEVLRPLGVPIEEKHTIATTGIRIDVIVENYFRQYPWQGSTTGEVTEQILQRVMALVSETRPILPGVHEALAFFQQRGLKIGLASSSPLSLIDHILKELELESFFEQRGSAEHLRFGKPNPQVYINVADALGVEPGECFAIEDSVTGMIAAKAAQMITIVVPDNIQAGDKRWILADERLDTLSELPDSRLFNF